MTVPDPESSLSKAAQVLPPEADIAVLEALAAEGEDVVARLPSGVAAFHTRLIFVDPERQFVLIQASGDTTANAALLAAPRATLHAESGDWRIEFNATNPQPAVHEGARAIRLAFPRSIAINRRRQQERVVVPPQLELRCVGYYGGSPCFSGAVIDVSEGGIGMMKEFSKFPLQPGTALSGYRLERPGKDPVTLDLEVRFVESVAGADGGPSLKVGCRIVKRSPDLLALIGEFLGKKS
jgi:c-di-GMP-binding flagellar brake protein YcgR